MAEVLGPSEDEILQPPGVVQVGSELELVQGEEAFAIQKQHPREDQHGKPQDSGERITNSKITTSPPQVAKTFRRSTGKEVKTMLELGVIEPSKSERRSHPVMVSKPDGTVGVCLDFRKVHVVSHFDAYPMPCIIGTVREVGNCPVLDYSGQDQGVLANPFRPLSKQYTAFPILLGLFQFKRVPFGLHGVAATFQRLVDKLLVPRTHYAAAYIDDIIIFSSSWEELLRHLGAVIQAFGQAGLTINPEKCKVGMRTTQYLGFMVGQRKVRPVISKVQAIQLVPTPTCRRDIQRFLGMVGYYRTFIPQFSKKAASFNRCN